MTPEEARQLLAETAAPFEATFDDEIFSNPPLADGYEAADPSRQALLCEAAELLVMTGQSGYRGHITAARQVLGMCMVDPQRLSRFVAAYRDGGQHSTEELSYIVGGAGEVGFLSDADLDILQELFITSPARHLIVGRAVLASRPAGPAWDALLAHIAESEDPTWLAAVCMFLTDRQVFKGDDRLSVWYSHMLAKPLSLRRATAAKVTARPWGLETELGLE